MEMPEDSYGGGVYLLHIIVVLLSKKYTSRPLWTARISTYARRLLCLTNTSVSVTLWQFGRAVL